MPRRRRPPVPAAPFAVPAPERAAPAPPPASAPATGLTPWASEAIRVLSAELSYLAPGPPAPPEPRDR